MSTTPQLHYRVCNLCEAMCGLEIQHIGSEVLSIKGDKNDPFSQGHICPKAMGLKDIFEDPNRLKRPVKKVGEDWEEISWEEAYETVASRIKEIQAQYGPASIGIYAGNPNVHNVGSILNLPLLIKAIKTPNLFSATSADQLPHHFAALEMFGHYMALPIPDIDRTDYMLILGGNPLASNGSIMTVPNVAKRLRAIQERGGQVIVLDPRKTETADKATAHHFVRPGTDVYVLLGMIHTLFQEKLVSTGHLQPYLEGLAEIEQLVAAYSPEAVSQTCGMEAETIRQLARELAGAERGLIYGRMGVSTQAFGGACNWLLNVLNILTDNLDKAGGMMFTSPAMDYVANGSRGKRGRWKSRVRGLEEFRGELPVSAMLEEMTTPGEGQIKALITVAGNPVLSTPNGGELDKAMEELEFVACVDIYINETTRHADIILPPTTGLEASHYDMVFHALAVRNTTRFSQPMVEKSPEQRHDYEIFQSLTRAYTGQYNAYPTPEMVIDMGLQAGPYKDQGITVAKLKAHPSGIDLGPLMPVIPERLFREDKKIPLCPEVFVKDMPRIAAGLKPNGREDYPFLLIGRRHLRSNNSWMHNSHRLVKGRQRCTAMIHPEDASKLGIDNGQEIKVRSATGAVQIPAEVTDSMMPGVISIPHGWGHGKKGVKLDVAQAHAGVSLNDLTDHRLIDPVTGNAAFSGVPVHVSA